MHDQIFRTVARTPDARFSVSVSYVQIYCELISDLLSPSGGDPLLLREDPDRGVYIDGLSEYHISDTHGGLHYLEAGAANRATAATRLNAHSSRSHAAFIVSVERRGGS